MLKINLILFCLCVNSLFCIAQTYRAPYIKAGTSQPIAVPPIPYSIVAPNTVIFKAEVEIVLGPDNSVTVNDEFNTQNFMNNANGYFHAYLIPPLVYAELKKQLDGSYCETIDKALSFKYVEKYLEGSLNYQIYDYQRNPMIVKPITNPLLIFNKKVGENYFSINLSLISFTATAEEATYYTLEVTNEKNEKTILRFRYSPNE